MSLDKWAYLDYGKIPHWWLGNEGTACGRDFKSDLRIADDIDVPVCAECLMALGRTLDYRREASSRGVS